MIWPFIAIILFAAGVISKMSWLRLMSIILTGVTLTKLIIVDRSRFTTEQKIISYIVIGILLLVLSFFYQKFKQTMNYPITSYNKTGVRLSVPYLDRILPLT